MTDFKRLPFQLLAAAVFAAIVGLTAWQHYQKCAKLSRLGTQTKTAFLRWRPQLIGEETPGRGPMPGLANGADIYRLYNYPNPPILALILRPLAELPPMSGAMIWFFLKLAMAALGFVWAFRLVGPIPDWAKLGAILFALHPILGDLSHGNVNIFIAFVCLGAMELYRRGWDVSGGIVLALAIACKVTPLLFVPHFGWKLTAAAFRAYRDQTSIFRAAWSAGGRLLLGCAVGSVVWFLLVPGAVLGWERNLALIESWYTVMAKPFLVDGKITSEHANQSIPGAVVRLLTDEPSSIEYDEDDRPVPAGYHNVADIGAAHARWLIRFCQAIWVGVLLWRGWAKVEQLAVRTGPLFAAEASYVFVGMLLFSERTWKHHATTLILPFATIFAALATPGMSCRRRWFYGILLGLVLILQFGPSVGPGTFQDDCLAYGSHTLLFLLLIAGIASLMKWNPGEPSP